MKIYSFMPIFLRDSFNIEENSIENKDEFLYQLYEVFLITIIYINKNKFFKAQQLLIGGIDLIGFLIDSNNDKAIKSIEKSLYIFASELKQIFRNERKEFVVYLRKQQQSFLINIEVILLLLKIN